MATKKKPKEFDAVLYAKDLLEEAMKELADNMRGHEDGLVRNDAAERLVRIAHLKQVVLQ